MSKKAQISYENQFSILIIQSSSGQFWAQIQDERGSEIWEQKGMSETRSDAVDVAEQQLHQMYEDMITHLQDQDA
jgi:hypothetical protein